VVSPDLGLVSSDVDLGVLEDLPSDLVRGGVVGGEAVEVGVVEFGGLHFLFLGSWRTVVNTFY
jgi:hypothetical protein